jgi:spore germination protein YaaH
MRFLLAYLVVLGLYVPKTAHADGAFDSPRALHSSIHARELSTWNEKPARDWKNERQPAPRKSRGFIGTATQTHTILGFHPYWMGTKYLAYDWSTLHTVVFFALEISATGSITNAHSWPWTNLVTHAHNNNARILVAATQFSSSDLAVLLGSATNRAAAVASIVNAMVAGNADGVCLDFEAIPGSRKQQYVDFASELRTAMTITYPQSQLIITTPAVDWNNAYDFDELAAQSDYLLLMAYDYHWTGSTTSGPVAPLAGWGTYNVDWSIQDHLTWGAPAAKLLLGVPYYGYRWDTSTDLPAASTTPPGTALTYGTVQPMISAQEEIWDAVSQTPWLRTQNPGWQQIWFDDAQSLLAKYQAVQSEGLAGVGIWALGYDDPYTELWNMLHTAFDQTTSDIGPIDTNMTLRIVSANPFAQSVVLASGRAIAGREVRIFDVRGRLVRRLLPNSGSLGNTTFVWDGRTDHGIPAGRGIYLASPAGSPGSVRLLKSR